MSNKPRKTNRASETLAWGTARPKGEKREREREREPAGGSWEGGAERTGWGPVFVRVIYPKEARCWVIFNFAVLEN